MILQLTDGAATVEARVDRGVPETGELITVHGEPSRPPRLWVDGVQYRPGDLDQRFLVLTASPEELARLALGGYAFSR